MEKRTARLTILIDPRKKKVFEELCDKEDITPSQVLRKYIRVFLKEKMGPDWKKQVFENEE